MLFRLFHLITHYLPDRRNSNFIIDNFNLVRPARLSKRRRYIYGFKFISHQQKHSTSVKIFLESTIMERLLKNLNCFLSMEEVISINPKLWYLQSLLIKNIWTRYSYFSFYGVILVIYIRLADFPCFFKSIYIYSSLVLPILTFTLP